jgi:hypothetical protein
MEWFFSYPKLMDKLKVFPNFLVAKFHAPVATHTLAKLENLSKPALKNI